MTSKTELVEATDIFSLHIISDCFSLVLQMAMVIDTTGCMRRYLDLHKQSSSSRMAHEYVLLKEGLLCLPAQCQEHSRRQAVLHPSTGLASTPLCKEEQDELCVSSTK